MKPPEGRTQIVCFGVGAGRYALDILRIKEIINPLPITPVPRAPAFVEGIIELRGAFLPVIDLRKRFDLPAAPLDRDGKYIIARLAGRAAGLVVALVVDRVLDARPLDLARIQPAPPLAVAGEARFFSGVVKQEEEIVLLVDLDAVLSAEEQGALADLDGRPD
jgi:purine-binding chemotaxis protein CheW